MRIHSLEEALETALLIRDSGQVQLTERGAEILVKARDVLWASEALLEEAGRRDAIDERLRLGVTELVACTWLQAFLRALKQLYPNIQVELQVDLSAVIEQRLIDGQLDLAFQSGPFNTSASGDIILREEPYVWVATPELAAMTGSSPPLPALFQRPVLTHAKHTQAGLSLHKVAEEQGMPTGQIIHSSALSACLPMVREGMGIALLPEALVTADLRAGNLQILEVDWLPKPLAFHARYDRTRNPHFVAKAATLARDAMQSGLA